MLYVSLFFFFGQFLQSAIQVIMWLKFWVASLSRFLGGIVTILWCEMCFSHPVVNSGPSSIFHYSLFSCPFVVLCWWFLLSQPGITLSLIPSYFVCQNKTPFLSLSYWFFVLVIVFLFVLFYACFLCSLPTGVLQLEGPFLFQVSFASDAISILFNIILFTITASVLV